MRPRTKAALGDGGVATLFVAMAAIQFNDPDPLLWLTVYLAIAAVPATKIFGLRLPVPFGVVVGLVSAALLLSLPGFVDYLKSGDYASLTGGMSAAKPYVESAREFLGAAIGAFCLLFYRRWHFSAANP